MIVRHSFDPTWRTRLEQQGVPRQDMLFNNRQINLDRACSDIKTQPSGCRPITLTVKTQLRHTREFAAHPFDSHLCFAIASQPSDLKAKQTAIWLFSEALSMYVKRSRGKSISDTGGYPRWHRVYGGLGDPLLSGVERPSFLVLSNVLVDSTNYKIEKVRDLLEKYNDIPRIVVIGGCNPIDFFYTRLHYPLDACLWIGSENRPITLDAEDQF